LGSSILDISKHIGAAEFELRLVDKIIKAGGTFDQARIREDRATRFFQRARKSHWQN